jgi:hypothetical protein
MMPPIRHYQHKYQCWSDDVTGTDTDKTKANVGSVGNDQFMFTLETEIYKVSNNHASISGIVHKPLWLFHSFTSQEE